MALSDKLNNVQRGVSVRFGTIGRLFKFLWQNKMWWLIPMIALIVAFFLIIIFAQSSPLGPFIYTIF